MNKEIEAFNRLDVQDLGAGERRRQSGNRQQPMAAQASGSNDNRVPVGVAQPLNKGAPMDTFAATPTTTA